jgi:hypothetical protein
MREAPTEVSPRLRLLIDTNVLIAVEPFAGHTERTLAPGARLLRAVAEQGHELYIHRATVDDIEQDHDGRRRGNGWRSSKSTQCLRTSRFLPLS